MSAIISEHFIDASDYILNKVKNFSTFIITKELHGFVAKGGINSSQQLHLFDKNSRDLTNLMELQ